MSSESPKFIVTSETTEAIINKAKKHRETSDFLRHSIQKMRKQHPLLYTYIAQTAQTQDNYWYPYSISSSLTYELISLELESRSLFIDIAVGDIQRHRNTAERVFSDPRWSNADWVMERAGTREGIDADSGLGFFFNILDTTAPDLAEYTRSITQGIDDPSIVKSTLRGFYDGVMPFYRHLKVSSEMKSP